MHDYNLSEDGAAARPFRPAPAKLMSVLSNETRMEVLAALAIRRSGVGDLARRLDLDNDAISHALQILRHAGLVQSRAVGKRRIYRLARVVKSSTSSSAVLLEIKWKGGGVRLELNRTRE